MQKHLAREVLLQILGLFLILSCGSEHTSNFKDEASPHQDFLISEREVSDDFEPPDYDPPEHDDDDGVENDDDHGGRHPDDDAGGPDEPRDVHISMEIVAGERFAEVNSIGSPTADSEPLTKEAAEHFESYRYYDLSERSYRNKNTDKTTYKEGDEDRLRSEIAGDRQAAQEQQAQFQSDFASHQQKYNQQIAQAVAAHNASVKQLYNSFSSLSSLAYSNELTFKTPRESQEGRKLYDAANYRNFVKEAVARNPDPARQAYGKELIGAADTALQLADHAYTDDKSVSAGDYYIDLSLNILDTALSIIPGTATAIDLLHIFTGKTLAGETLSQFDRVLTAATLFVPGVAAKPLRHVLSRINNLSGEAIRSGKVWQLLTNPSELKKLNQLYTNAESVGFTNPADIVTHQAVLERWSPSYRVTNIVDASVVNSIYEQPPYLRDSKVIDFVTTMPEVFYRAHGADNIASSWLARKDDYRGLSATQIKEKFNIDQVPTHLSEAHVPTGTPMRTGIVGPNRWGQSSGPVQYQVTKDLDKVEFKNPRQIEGDVE